MATEQIEQQLRTTRLAIDYKLDLIGARLRGTRRRALPIASGIGAMLLAAFAWRMYRRRTARRRLRLVA